MRIEAGVLMATRGLESACGGERTGPRSAHRRREDGTSVELGS
jgi:hypothetical protein